MAREGALRGEVRRLREEPRNHVESEEVMVIEELEDLFLSDRLFILTFLISWAFHGSSLILLENYYRL